MRYLIGVEYSLEEHVDYDSGDYEQYGILYIYLRFSDGSNEEVVVTVSLPFEEGSCDELQHYLQQRDDEHHLYELEKFEDESHAYDDIDF